MRIEAKIMNRFLRTERAIYLMLSQLKGDRRHHSKSVSLIQGSGEFLRGWGESAVSWVERDSDLAHLSQHAV